MVGRITDDSPKPDHPDTGSDEAVRDAETSQTPKSEKTETSVAESEPTSPKKPRRRKPAPSKKARATSVKADLDKLDARLDRIDETTRRSIESLHTIITALEANVGTTDGQKGQLTRHVDMLSKRLDQQASQVRSVVRSELKTALSQGGIDRLDAAVGRASIRLDEAEIAQAEAITKLNRHLADMARAVDARMQAEVKNRRAEMDQMREKLTYVIATSQSKIEKRIEAVEHDSAEALNRVGSTIEQIHNRLEQRQHASSSDVAEKVNELALQTQADFEAYQAHMETRLKEVEARHLAVGTGAAERVVERVSQDLETKVDGLRRRVDELASQTSQASPPKSAPLPPLPNTVPTALTSVETQTDHTQSDDLPPNPIQTLKDRLTSFRNPAAVDESPKPAPAAGFGSADTPNPYAAALDNSPPPPLTLDHIVSAPTPTPTKAPAPAPVSPPMPFPAAQTADGAPPPLPPFQMPSSLPPLQPTEAFEPAPMPDNVYSNPAYAESMNMRAGLMARAESPVIGRGNDQSWRDRVSLPNITGRHIRVAALATGVAVVAMMAGRMILGTGDTPDEMVAGGPSPVVTNQVPPSTQAPPTTLVAPTGTDPNALPDGGTEPIGDYLENQPVVIDAAELDTLEAAVQAGNPIAQFQMGLSKLEVGETEEGAALIRQSASANQPAALYRLAKLYEAGEGVPQDDVMARQLIERAARGGNRIAMHDLALFYTEGRGGVELDMSAAKSWFEQAARRGVVDSQFNLAVLSESTEIGLQPDTEEALFWYSIAANQGDQFAVSRRDALRATLDPDQLADIDQRIETFTPRAIDEAANGIFNNVPWVKNADASPQQVRDVQTKLAALGYSVGTPDGMMGSQTRTAIAEFERANGLSETGEISNALISRLNQAAGT